jgi:hypothetical protein
MWACKRITAFTDDSKAASAVSFCYDKLREAELRRNVWVFSIRKAALRPVDTTTKLLAPAAWARHHLRARRGRELPGPALGEPCRRNLASTPGLTEPTGKSTAGPMTIRPVHLNSGATAST